jgi:DNA-binding NarL/FixJ family response regulator
MRVLIADDSAVVVERLVTLLSELPEVDIVGEAQTSGDATERIQQLQPDVVILDIQLPGGSGIGVLETVKKNQPAPIVIMFTNFPYPQYREKCLRAGADFFFDKSTEFDQLIGVFRSLLHRPGGCRETAA